MAQMSKHPKWLKIIYKESPEEKLVFLMKTIPEPKLRQKFIMLGWELIKHRCLYYYYEDYVQLPDRVYDRLEERYKKMAKKLGESPTAIEDVQPNRLKGSVYMVEQRIKFEIDCGLLQKTNGR